MHQPPAYWRHSHLNLIATRCQTCQSLHFPQVNACTKCFETEKQNLESEQLPTTGTVYSFTVVHKGSTAFKDAIPYTIAIIKLDKTDIKLTGQVANAEQPDIHIGAPVTAIHRIITQDGDTGLIHYGIKWQVKK
jgi:hypothetical protein